MAASWWFWEPRHIWASRDAVAEAYAAMRLGNTDDQALTGRLLEKLEACAQNPEGGIQLTKRQTEALADILDGYAGGWAREAQEIIEQALRLAAEGVPKKDRVKAAQELLERLNRRGQAAA